MAANAAASTATNFATKLQEYYELKAEYEANVKKLTTPIIRSKELTLADKRRLVAAIKPKCVNCARPVGTRFDISITEDTKERKLTATCGDIAEPCPLDIELTMGDVSTLPRYMADEEADLRRIRREIIRLKNDLLVGLITEEDVLAKFDELKTDVNVSNELMEHYMQLYVQIAANPATQTRLRLVEADRFKLRDTMAQGMRDFARTNDAGIVRNVVELYQTQFMPLVQETLQSKWQHMAVVAVTEKTRADVAAGVSAKQRVLYLLEQVRVTVANLEYALIEPRVVKFQRGLAAASGRRPAAKRLLGRRPQAPPAAVIEASTSESA